LHDHGVGRRARDVSSRVQSADALSRACELIEQLK